MASPTALRLEAKTVQASRSWPVPLLLPVICHPNAHPPAPVLLSSTLASLLPPSGPQVPPTPGPLHSRFPLPGMPFAWCLRGCSRTSSAHVTPPTPALDSPLHPHSPSLLLLCSI